MPQQNDFIPVNWRRVPQPSITNTNLTPTASAKSGWGKGEILKIAITDNLGAGHIMMCNVVAETDDTVVIENGRKTYTMIFCKKTGRHLNPLPSLLDCLVLGSVNPVLCSEHPRGRVLERGFLREGS